MVRVAAANLNFNHLEIGPKDGDAISSLGRDQGGGPGGWRRRQIFQNTTKSNPPPSQERIGRWFPAAFLIVAPIPAIKWELFPGPFRSDQVERMLKLALETPERTPDRLATRCRGLRSRDRANFRSARTMQKPGFFNFLADPRNQYDPHAQIVIRLRDQDGLPIPIAQSDVFFVSNQQEKGTIPIQTLIRGHIGQRRLAQFDSLLSAGAKIRCGKNRIGSINCATFSISLSRSPRSSRRRSGQNPLVSYLPLRLPLNRRQMSALIQPHRTTIVDVTLLRLPAPEVYQLIKS